jgi:ABC-type transport system substrate-binding protein
VFHDAARVADGDIPDFLWAYNSKKNALAYDPERARALLREAGWSGKPLELQLTYANNSAVERGTAVLVQSMLANIGIQLSLKAYPNEVLSASFGAGGIIDNGKFIMTTESVATGVDPDDSWQITCSAIPPGGFNDARYCNPSIDTAEKAALRSYDRPIRKAAYAEVKSLLNRDVPVVFIAWPRRLYVYNSDFRGFRPSLSGLTVRRKTTLNQEPGEISSGFFRRK